MAWNSLGVFRVKRSIVFLIVRVKYASGPRSVVSCAMSSVNESTFAGWSENCGWSYCRESVCHIKNP